MRKLSAEIDRPVSFAMVQHDNEPDAWRDALDHSLDALEDGAQLYPQVAARGISILLTLRGRHPFIFSDSYRELDALDWAERAAAMRDPQRRERILSEVAAPDAALGFIMWDKLYPMTDPPNYEPTPTSPSTPRPMPPVRPRSSSPTTSSPRTTASTSSSPPSSTTPTATSTPPAR